MLARLCKPVLLPYAGWAPNAATPQVVRDINERQAKELADAAEEARRLREQVPLARRPPPPPPPSGHPAGPRAPLAADGMRPFCT
jgi:hypothetical protein